MPNQLPLNEKRLLLLSDENRLRRIVEQTTSEMGGLIETVTHSAAAINRIESNKYDIILLTEALIDRPLQTWFQQSSRQQSLFLFSHSREPEKLVNWIHSGITDLLSPSINGEQLQKAMMLTLFQTAQEANQPSRKAIRDNHTFYGQHPLISTLLQQIEKISPRSSPVLLEGETGTGKSFFARRIHELSDREGRLVSINCATFSPNLLESELFGHARGAFTGAEAARPGLAMSAENGTLFLDEISELPAELQPKLLQLLEEKTIRPVGSDSELPVNARIVAATNCDLKQMVKEGKFRADLYYRLNVIPLKIPSLRSRTEDIPDLVRNFIEELCEEHNLPATTIQNEPMAVLKQGPWLGNVRELRNHLERALLLGLPFEEGIEQLEQKPIKAAEESGWLRLEEHEKIHILRALDKSNGNKSQAALLLGIARRTLERKLKRWEEDAA